MYRIRSRFYRRVLKWLDLESHERYISYYLMQLGEQVFAVLPLTLFVVIAIAIFFQAEVGDAGTIAGGQVAVIFGLVLFLEGLKMAFIPLGLITGTKLPKRRPLWVLALVAWLLGILVVYAEPAIGALRVLGKSVDAKQAPYLAFLLNEWQELTVLSIGIGAGFAVILGMFRIVNHWSLKPCIFGTLVPAFILSIVQMWGKPELRTIIAMAWDTGAVTTGAVTVPILLSIGNGLHVTGTAGADRLSGFGIVTLASIWPILSVQLLSLVLYAAKSKEEVAAIAQAAQDSQSW